MRGSAGSAMKVDDKDDFWMLTTIYVSYASYVHVYTCANRPIDVILWAVRLFAVDYTVFWEALTSHEIWAFSNWHGEKVMQVQLGNNIIK